MIDYFEQSSIIILIIVKNKIIETINTISKILQGSHEDMEKDIEMLSSLLSQFLSFRYHWDFVKNDALELSTVWNIELFYARKRVHRSCEKLF